jgi:hypothetical protein
VGAGGPDFVCTSSTPRHPSWARSSHTLYTAVDSQQTASPSEPLQPAASSGYRPVTLLPAVACQAAATRYPHDTEARHLQFPGFTQSVTPAVCVCSFTLVITSFDTPRHTIPESETPQPPGAWTRLIDVLRVEGGEVEQVGRMGWVDGMCTSTCMPSCQSSTMQQYLLNEMFCISMKPFKS